MFTEEASCEDEIENRIGGHSKNGSGIEKRSYWMQRIEQAKKAKNILDHGCANSTACE